MSVDVSEAGFEREVVERSRKVPVVADFWAEWCGPCRTLTPALVAAESARDGKVVLAKVDVDADQALAARYGVQGIPAVKAFRDGAVVDEFVGAVSKAQVEKLFDGLAPSRADELMAAGDELSLREAAELEPGRAGEGGRGRRKPSRPSTAASTALDPAERRDLLRRLTRLTSWF